jgi:hypothetical protein
VFLRVVTSFFVQLRPYKSAGGAFDDRRHLNKHIMEELSTVEFVFLQKYFYPNPPRRIQQYCFRTNNQGLSQERANRIFPTDPGRVTVGNGGNNERIFLLLSNCCNWNCCIFKMKIVGYCADRHGYLRNKDEKGGYGRKDHLLSQQDSYSSQTCLLANERNPTISSTCLQLKYRYRDLQDEGEGEARSSKICGGQFLYKWKLFKGSSRDYGTDGRKSNSSSLTVDGSSESSSAETEVQQEEVDEKPLCSNTDVQSYQVEAKYQPCDNSLQEKLNIGNRGTYIDLLPYHRGQEQHNIKDTSSLNLESILDNSLEGDSLMYSLSDIGMSNSFSAHEWFDKEESRSDKDNLTKHWIHPVQDEMTNVIITKLLEDCEHYQTETLALREEIEFMKIELGCLRQQIPGLKSAKMLV